MKFNTKTVVLVSVLSAMAVVLMMFPKFSLIPAFPFLEVDFSDVPALFASVAISPLAGLLVVLIKNLIHFLTASSTGGVGELSNVICGAARVVTAGLASRLLLRAWPVTKKLPLALLLAAAAQIVAALLGNYFLMIPLYHIQSMASEYILGGVLPFNLAKDAIVCVTFYLLFRLLYPRVGKLLN